VQSEHGEAAQGVQCKVKTVKWRARSEVQSEDSEAAQGVQCKVKTVKRCSECSAK
jgi:DNA-directed RNA polymerase specialized sigma24 family protein